MNVLYFLLWCLVAIVAAALLYILILFISGLFVDIHREYKKDSAYYRLFLDSGAWFATFFARVKIHTSGLEKIPSEGRFLVVGNHRSNFDAIITWRVLKKYQLAFISKMGNFKIPFYGRIVCRCCTLEIDKTSPRKSMETLNRASELLKNDEVSIGVYPEGTRSRSGRLQDFHDGVFKIAKKADVPIVVVCLENTISIHKNFPLHRTHVQFTVTDVIPADYVEAHSTHEISQRVRDSLLEQLGEVERKAS